MRCPNCDSDEVSVTDSRCYVYNDAEVVRRRRECLSCEARWTTIEMVIAELLNLNLRPPQKRRTYRERMREGR